MIKYVKKHKKLSIDQVANGFIVKVPNPENTGKEDIHIFDTIEKVLEFLDENLDEPTEFKKIMEGLNLKNIDSDQVLGSQDPTAKSMTYQLVSAPYIPLFTKK